LRQGRIIGLKKSFTVIPKSDIIALYFMSLSSFALEVVRQWQSFGEIRHLT
jgi:hypothetical protein